MYNNEDPWETPPSDRRCICSSMSNLGDMAPRMWECAVHGITGMWHEMSIIENYTKKSGISEDVATKEAYELLQRKHKEYRKKGEIYYDEDYFDKDLSNYFNSHLGYKGTSPNDAYKSPLWTGEDDFPRGKIDETPKNDSQIDDQEKPWWKFW